MLGLETDGKSRAAGIISTVVFHLLLLLVTVTSGLRYVYPPPPEKTILVEFEPEKEIKPIEVAAGKEPRTPDPDPSKPVTLVQKSESPVATGKKQNYSKEATVGDKGDVEVPEPERKKEINQRALFSAANNNQKDTLAPQTADKITDALNAGHAAGNTHTGSSAGEPSAKLEGRSVMGSLPLPSYRVQDAGTVTVKVLVDRNGNVVDARPLRSTTPNSALLKASVDAAYKAKFNTSESAPDLQEGTITYKYKLR